MSLEHLEERPVTLWASGGIISPIGDGFFGDEGTPSEMLYAAQARWLAHTDGCPTVNNAIERYGAKGARDRYAEINFAWELILSACSDREDKTLYTCLTTPTERDHCKPVGIYESDSVPDLHLSTMAGLTLPWNYAGARILVDMFGKRGERTIDSVDMALKSLDMAIADSPNQIDFVINLSMLAFQNGGKAENIFHYLFSKGYVKEENCLSLILEIYNKMRSKADTLYEMYKSMTRSTKYKLGIIDFA